MTGLFSENLADARRYLALFLPILPADRWLREGRGLSLADCPPDDHPKGDSPQGTVPARVFVEKQRGAMRIVAADEGALALGISPGMMLADARARVPDLHAAPHDPAGDAALLKAIAEDCDRFTPMVALDPPDGLILDITGCAHLWGDEADLVSAIVARLAHGGFSFRLAIAETPDKARALARHGGESVAVNRSAPPGMLHEERAGYDAGPGTVPCGLSPSKWRKGTVREGQSPHALPVSALDPDEKQATALRRAGLYTVGDIASRPRAPFAARFGRGFTTRLARVLGEEDARITPLRSPPALFFLRRFAEPVAHGDIVLASISALAEEADTALRARGEGGRDFRVSLFRSDGAIHRMRVETGTPTRDPALLIRLFRERIDALSDPLDPGFGYDAIRLDIARTETLGSAQIDLAGEARGAEDVEGLIDRLGVRLGAARVRRLVPGNSHIPELAGLSAPAAAPPLPMPWPGVDAGEPPLRPLHLFDPPQRIEAIAEVPDGPPRRFRWRRTTHDVVAHEGPERIASEWWRRRTGHLAGQAGLTRDYYRVEDTQGRRFWVFRHGLYGAEREVPDWYVHGVFG